MKKIIILAIALSAILDLQAQTSYYVDGINGDDGYTGTSLGQAWGTIQYAFDNATPGSTVYIRGGTYYENVYAGVSGTAGNPITFRNYQNEVVILDGTGTTEQDMLYIEDQSDLVIENITIRNKVAAYATGVTISCTAGASIQNILLHNLKITGINWTSDTSAVPTSDDNSNPLIVVGSGTNQVNAITNVTIDSCEVFNNITGFSESISLDGNIDGFVVSNNIVHDNKNIGIDMAGNYGVCSNPTFDHARNGHCYDNTCYKNVSGYATSAGIYVDGGANIIIERNTSYRNGFGIEIGCEENGSTSNITVRDNVIYNNKQSGLAIGGYTGSTTGQVLNSFVLNNTFLKDDYSNSGMGEVYISKMSDCTIRNNIFYTNAQNIMITRDNITPFSGNSIDYNCWYTPNNNSSDINVAWGAASYTSFSDYTSATGMDANSVYADPQLASGNVSSPDLHIPAGSPCIDAGDPAFAPATGELDYYGGARVVNSRVDIGANENPSPTFADANDIDLSVIIYPNPVSTYAVLTIPNFKSEYRNPKSESGSCFDIRISDLTGKVVRTIPLTLFPHGSYPNEPAQITIDCGDLNPGIYFIKVKTDKGVVVKKIIKE